MYLRCHLETMLRTVLVLFCLVVFSARAAFTCSNDNVCEEESESCLWCSDCSCTLSGWKAETWSCLPSYVRKNLGVATNNATCKYHVENVIDTDVPSVIKTSSGPLYSEMISYLTVPKTKHYQLKVESVNVGFILRINGIQIVSSALQQPKNKAETSIILQQGRIHTVKMELFSTLAGVRSLSFQWHVDSSNEFTNVHGLFFNYKICGDHIYDSGEDCTSDLELTRIVPKSNNTCGDGVCQDRFPESCFVDCHSLITQQCSPIAPSPNRLGAGTPTRDDTIGALIDNQVLWQAPGIEHMTYGFDVIKGSQTLFPIFYFGYCDKDNLRTVQDTYRGHVYTVPNEVFVKPSPVCSFNTDSQMYTSSIKFANSMVQKSIGGYSGATSFIGLVNTNTATAFFEERSVEKARDLETKTLGSILVTDITCETSRVQFNKYTFHPSFLADLAEVNSTSALKQVISRYGTHFMVNALLGGRLRQVTSISKSFRSSKTKDELRESASLSIHTSSSTPVFGAKFRSFVGSLDTTTTEEQQKEFENNSFRSSVLTYGGPPGAFGPQTPGSPTSFSTWASSVDLLPVPIEYTLKPISDIIPKSWKFSESANVVHNAIADEWKRVVDDFFSNLTPHYEEDAPWHYIVYLEWNPSLASLPDTKLEVTFTDGTSTKISLTHPRAGYPMYPSSTVGLPNPWRYDFSLPYSVKNISNVALSTSLPTYTVISGSVTYIWPGEGMCSILLHALNEGIELGFKNHIDYESSTTGGNVYRTYYWSRRDDPLKSLQMYFELEHDSGVNISSGLVEISLFGITGKRYTTSVTLSSITTLSTDRYFQPFKIYRAPQIQSIANITKATIRVSTSSSSAPITPSTSTTFNLRNFSVTQYMCKNNTLTTDCTLANSEKRIFAAPFDRKYKISNIDRLPILVNLYRPSQIMDLE